MESRSNRSSRLPAQSNPDILIRAISRNEDRPRSISLQEAWSIRDNSRRRLAGHRPEIAPKVATTTQHLTASLSTLSTGRTWLTPRPTIRYSGTHTHTNTILGPSSPAQQPDRHSQIIQNREVVEHPGRDLGQSVGLYLPVGGVRWDRQTSGRRSTRTFAVKRPAQNTARI